MDSPPLLCGKLIHFQINQCKNFSIICLVRFRQVFFLHLFHFSLNQFYRLNIPIHQRVNQHRRHSVLNRKGVAYTPKSTLYRLILFAELIFGHSYLPVDVLFVCARGGFRFVGVLFCTIGRKLRIYNKKFTAFKYFLRILHRKSVKIQKIKLSSDLLCFP